MCNDHVSGPVSSLPGSVQKNTSQMCDEHPDQPSVVRMQGETDSFGAEYFFMCQGCYHKFQQEKAVLDAEPRVCDWCGQLAPLRPRRDWTEGSCGPVYNVCLACVKKENENFAAENDVGEDPDHGDWDD